MDRVTTHVPVLRTSSVPHMPLTDPMGQQSVSSSTVEPISSQTVEHVPSQLVNLVHFPCASRSMVQQTTSDAVLATESRAEEFEDSPTPVLTTVAPDSSSLVGNTHSIVTRAKAGIPKPKIFCTEFQECGPRTINEAFATP